MKKLSFFLMAMLFSVMSFAAEVTETVTMKGFAGLSTSAYENVTKTGASDKGTAMVAYAFNPSTGQVRGNKTQIAGASVTSKDDAKNWSLYNVDAMAGAIKSIKITCAADGSNYFKSNMYVALGTSSQGAVTTISGAQKNTTASNAEFTFDIDATKGYTYFKLLSNEKFTSGSVKGVVVTITYEAADNYVAVPSITGETYFKENTTVTLTASEGQKVYYTLDGTEPTNASTEYTAPFELTETTTVKAIAYQGENASEVAEQVFKKMQVLTCAEAAAITPNGDKYIVRGYVTKANEYSAQYNNIDFFVADTKDGGEVLKAYRAIPVTEEDKAVKEGDYVEIIGVLSAYNGTVQVAQGGTYTIIPEPAPEPTTETVYFVNTKNWETVTAHAWEGNAAGTTWPGLPTVKEEEQIGGYDVYSLTANVGDYAKVLFNNNGQGDQTGDLEWTAGKYYVKDGWYTKEEAEAKLAQPTEYESVYLIDNQNWGNANIYTWQPEVKSWPGAAMTKEAEQLAGFDVYSYTVEKGTAFGGMLFNNGTVQTVDLTWTAGQYYLLEEKNGEGKWAGKWCTKEEALELLGGTPEEPTYEVFEEEITDLVVDVEAMTISGGPSANYMVKVILGLGDYDRNEGTYQLLPESYVSIQGTDATFVDGYVAELDAFTPSAKAVVRCVWNGMNVELHLNMSAAPMEATVVVVENATAKVEKYLIFGDEYEHSLKITGEWLNPEDGVTYPVLVEVPVYYPESTEPSEILSTVTVGGGGDNDPWFGFGEGTLTITTVGDVVTATGVVQNPMAGIAIDITITGKISTGHTVTILVTPEGAGTVTGAGEYEDGAEVTVTAEENDEYIFWGWLDATTEEFVAYDYEYTFQVLDDVTLIAYYLPYLEGMATDLVIGENTLTASVALDIIGTLNMNLVLGEYDEEEGYYYLAETTTLGNEDVIFMEGIAMVVPEAQMAAASFTAMYDNTLYYIIVVMTAPETGVDNINTNVAPRKVIRDGQLIIIKNGVEYNVQGAKL